MGELPEGTLQTLLEKSNFANQKRNGRGILKIPRTPPLNSTGYLAKNCGITDGECLYIITMTNRTNHLYRQPETNAGREMIWLYINHILARHFKMLPYGFLLNHKRGTLLPKVYKALGDDNGL
ncbi:MAG: hypothetical protein ACTS73_08015 [Arsenophonus sp. NEOnobi-MAG3]